MYVKIREIRAERQYRRAERPADEREPFTVILCDARTKEYLRESVSHERLVSRA